MKNILLVVNPISGKMKAKSTLLDILKVLESKEDVYVTVQVTKERGHATLLAKTAKQNGYDTIICFGGDGTLNEVICGISSDECRLPLGYIPAGSTNDFATSMDIPKDPVKAAEMILNGTSTPIDIGLFNGERFFTYVAAFGIFTSVSYSVSQGLKNALGHMAYVLSSVKEIAHIKSHHVKIETDERVIEGDYLFGAVANSTSVAGIVKLKKELVDFSDGLFEIGLIKKPKNLIELNKIITALTTSNFNNGVVEFYKASSLTVTSDEDFDWTLDGEYAKGNKTIKIEILNKVVDFIK